MLRRPRLLACCALAVAGWALNPTGARAATDCRAAALGAFGGIGVVAGGGGPAHRRVAWQMEAAPVPPECAAEGTWTISAYAAAFPRRHPYPSHPVRLGRTVSWANAAAGRTYARTQRLARRIPRGATVNAVVWATWTPHDPAAVPERRRSDGVAIAVGFDDCARPLGAPAFACDARGGGTGLADALVRVG